MLKFNAPIHTSDVHLTAGVFPVVDGKIEVPDNIGADDRAMLAVAGFTRDVTPAEPEPAPPARPSALAPKDD